MNLKKKTRNRRIVFRWSQLLFKNNYQSTSGILEVLLIVKSLCLSAASQRREVREEAAIGSVVVYISPIHRCLIWFSLFNSTGRYLIKNYEFSATVFYFR